VVKDRSYNSEFFEHRLGHETKYTTPTNACVRSTKDEGRALYSRHYYLIPCMTASCNALTSNGKRELVSATMVIPAADKDVQNK
jgi:hypothetical protein